MAIPLIETNLAGHLVEYSEYKFGPRTKTTLAVHPKYDSSGRTEVAREYTLRVSSYITPRRLIPGDEKMNGIQLPAPTEGVTPPGINPYSFYATTDSELKLILCRLTESGKTLRYCGQGLGDLYVNTINPNTGKFVQDLHFGPHCKILSLRPVGFKKAWYIEWQAVFTIQTCCDEKGIDLNVPGNRIQEFNYSVDYSYNHEGYATRTIIGKLIIVPPMYRGTNHLPQLGVAQPNAVDLQAAKDNINAALQQQVNLNQQLFNAEVALATAKVALGDFLDNKKKAGELTDATIAIGQQAIDDFRYINVDKTATNFVNRVTNARLDDAFNFDLVPVNNALALQFVNANKAVDDAIQPITNLRANLRILEEDIKKFKLILKRLENINLKIATSPEEALVFTNSPQKIIDPKIAFGRFPQDNRGNVQNYETVDQYWNAIFDNFPVPYSFERTNFNKVIHEDKRSLSFRIVDVQKPAFSVVPGYSKVSGTHSASSGMGFQQWQHSISCRFKFPKFINSVEANGTTYSTVDYFTAPDYKVPNPNLTKLTPRKMVAWNDFLKIVFQRFAMTLVAQHETKFDVTLPNGDKKLLEYSTIFPTGISINENLFDNEIAFSINYTMTANLKNVWQLSGFGLPAIIAADIDDSGIKAEGQNLNAQAGTARQFAAAVYFGKYTDMLVHKDWLESQKFAGFCPRGAAEHVYLDRTYDRPLNICEAEHSKPNEVIPEHKNYDVLSTVGEIKREGNKIPDFNFPDQKQPKSVPTAENKRRADELIKNIEENIKRAKRAGDTAEVAGDWLGANGWEEAALRWTGVRNFIKKRRVNSDIDIFLEDNLIVPYLSSEEKSTFNDLGDFRITSFASNNTYAQNDTAGTLHPGLGDEVVNRLLDIMGPPAPERSWLLYESAIEIITENNVVRHKLLPKLNLHPQTDTTGFSNYIENHFADIVPTGPDNLVGESINSYAFYSSIPEPDILQITSSPYTKIILRGYAIRVGYQPIPPTLLVYGGRRAIQQRARIKRMMLDKLSAIAYGCIWEIEYELDNIPVGPLAVPNKPYFTQETLDVEISANEYDVFELSYQIETNEQVTTAINPTDEEIQTPGISDFFTLDPGEE